MIHLALQTADATTEKAVRSIVGNRTATVEDLYELRKLLDNTGAKDGALKEGEQYAMQAKKAAHTAVSWGNKEAGILESIITFAMERET